MDEVLSLPLVGTSVAVRSLGNEVLTGIVTGHDTKDGKPIFDYQAEVALSDGRCVQTTKWAWLDQLVCSNPVDPKT